MVDSLITALLLRGSSQPLLTCKSIAEKLLEGWSVFRIVVRCGIEES
jgi:hypothetical protein